MSLNMSYMDAPTTAGGGFAASVGGPVIFTLGVTSKTTDPQSIVNTLRRP